MKVLVVSKTITNVGDFLYAERIKEILEKEFPNHSYIYNDGNNRLSPEEISEFDRIIVSGGPNYDNRLMSYDNFTFLESAFKYKIPIYLIGMGCYGNVYDDSDIYNYYFNSEVISILKTIEQQGGLLGTRDYITQRILKNNGLTKTIMTGCPAFYDMRFKTSGLRGMFLPQKIIVSDPGVTKIYEEQEARAKQAIDLVDYIIKKFPDSEIIFTFNGGIKTKYSYKCNSVIEEHLKKRNIKYAELSGSADNIEIYDDKDIHIGFRVHSHIYCLSRHIPTILLEEDKRGYGINEALGIPHIANYAISNEGFVPNPNMLNKLDNFIDESISNGFLYNRLAYNAIDYYYEHGMKKALSECLN